MGFGELLLAHAGNAMSGDAKNAKRHELACSESIVNVYEKLTNLPEDADREAVIDGLLVELNDVSNRVNNFIEGLRHKANTGYAMGDGSDVTSVNLKINLSNSMAELYNNFNNFLSCVQNDDMKSAKLMYINAKARAEQLRAQGVRFKDEKGGKATSGASESKGGWALPIVLLFLCPPVGLILCIMKIVKK